MPLTSGASAGRDSSEGRVSALLRGWHDLDLVLCGCFRLLLGASFLEGLAGLLGHVLSRRLIGHGCSLVGSLASSAGSTVHLLRADDAGSRYGARHAPGCGPQAWVKRTSELDVACVPRWCEQRVPERVPDQLGGRVRCRAPASDRPGLPAALEPGHGAAWTWFPIARLRYTKPTGAWELFWRDRNCAATTTITGRRRSPWSRTRWAVYDPLPG